MSDKLVAPDFSMEDLPPSVKEWLERANNEIDKAMAELPKLPTGKFYRAVIDGIEEQEDGSAIVGFKFIVVDEIDCVEG